MNTEGLKDKVKYYTSDQIRSRFHSLTKDEKIDILYAALEVMQQYNGRSKIKCIALAMGYENTEGLDNTYVKVD